MTCDEAKAAMAERWRGALDEADAKALTRHLVECAECAEESDELGRLWHALGELPAEAPSADLAARFAARLADEIALETALETRREAERRTLPSWSERLAGALGLRPAALRWAAAAATVAVGIGIGLAAGWRLGERAATGSGELAGLRQEVRSLHELVALSMLTHGSASERLQGVSYGRSFASQERVEQALLAALESDPNDNVRLAAADALMPLARARAGRARLVAAIGVQSSPTVELALIDLLLAAEAPAEELRPLVADRAIDPTVRSYLRARLERSI